MKKKKGACSSIARNSAMSIRDTNLALISNIPESEQKQIYLYLTEHYCKNGFMKPKTASEILDELSESRKCYENGEFRDFDEALDDISKKYGI